MVYNLYSSSNSNYNYSANSISAVQRLAQEVANTSATKTNRSKDTLTQTQKRLAASMLDDNLNPMAVAYHNIFSTVDEIQEYIYNKYFETPENALIERANNTEKYAMYENDINAVLYGLDENNTNFNDPRLNFTETDWARINFHSNDLDRMNAKMLEILEKYEVEADEDSYFVISFNPYDYSVTVEGNQDNQTIQTLTNALNSNQNSMDFFLYALQNTKSVNQNSIDKMKAYQNIFKYTGERLDGLNLVDGSFYNTNNQNILDVLKNNLQNNYLNNSFIDSEYNSTSNLLQNIARLGWNNIPDLELAMVYSMREGIFVPGVVYNV